MRTLALLLLATTTHAQVKHMTWAGHDRQYYVMVPHSAPTGLIVALSPATIEYTESFCAQTLGKVGSQTGALIVCPAALTYNSTGPGHPGAVGSPCWKSFAHYGYCEPTLEGRNEDSEDMNFLAALIEQIKGEYTIPDGRTIMSGISNGGSAAFRFNCEKSEMIDGLVIGIQAWFDPWVGYFDYVNHQLPSGTKQCNPTKKVPFYSADGTKDWFYGQPPCFPGFESVANWQNYSKDVLGCTGNRIVTSKGPHNFYQGSSTECYTYDSCSGIIGAGLNIMCEVTGMTHDETALAVLLPAAFSDFFGGNVVV